MTSESSQERSDRSRAWKAHLRQAETPERGAEYHYPTTDAAVDANLQMQDANKRTREQHLLRHGIDFTWQIALDYGCGLGAQFACFDSPEHRGGLLLGIEPDPQRAEQARTAADAVEHLDALIATGDARLLTSAPPSCSLDAIVCNQVLGHVAQAVMEEILAAFGSRLAPGGRCLISVPVCFAAGNGKAPPEDFTHLVRLDQSPLEASYREQLKLAQFESATCGSHPNVLAVRAFAADVSQADRDELPRAVERPPQTLAAALPKAWRLEACWLYSIHGEAAGAGLVLGDLMLLVSRPMKSRTP